MDAEMPSIPWEKWAEFTEGPNGDRLEVGGTKVARRVLAGILGPAPIRSAIYCCVEQEGGSETARSVLRHVRSPVATAECLTLLAKATNAEDQAVIAGVMADVAEPTVVGHLDALLQHPNPSVQYAVVKCLDELMMTDAINDEDFESWLARLEAHPNSEVRERARVLRSLHR